MAIGKLTTAAGRLASKKVTQAFKAGVKARKARQAASAKTAKAAERAAKRAANKAKTTKPKTTSTTSTRGPSARRRGYDAGTQAFNRKLAKPLGIVKKIAGNRIIQTGAAAYGGAKFGGGSSSNTVSNKSSYTQADYDEARKRIYGR